MNVQAERIGAAAMSRLARGLLFYFAAWLIGAALLTAAHVASPERRANADKPAPAALPNPADRSPPTRAGQDWASSPGGAGINFGASGGN